MGEVVGTWQCSFMAARSMIWKRLRRTVAGELMEVSSSSGWHLGRTCAHSFPTSAFPGSCPSHTPLTFQPQTPNTLACMASAQRMQRRLCSDRRASSRWKAAVNRGPVLSASSDTFPPRLDSLHLGETRRQRSKGLPKLAPDLFAPTCPLCSLSAYCMSVTAIHCFHCSSSCSEREKTRPW